LETICHRLTSFLSKPLFCFAVVVGQFEPVTICHQLGLSVFIRVKVFALFAFFRGKKSASISVHQRFKYVEN